MNKSISISLGGRVFHIEENAYDKLNSYLEQVRHYINSEEDAEEIITDIEHRIAELFYEFLRNREAVNENDVNKVIETLGKPESFSEENEESDFQDEQLNKNVKKSLYRDYDNKIIGGVLAGFAKYFGVDVTWFRLGFILLVIFGNFIVSPAPFVIGYLICLVIIPYAKTTSEKLQMEGKPINLGSIKENFSISNDSSKKISKQISSTLELFFIFLKKLFIAIGGIFFLTLGISLIFGLFAVYNHFYNESLPFNVFTEMTFNNNTIYIIAVISFCLLLLIPAYYFIILGLKALIKKFNSPILRGINIGLFVVWIVSMIGLITVSSFTMNEFKADAERKTTEIIKTKSDTLTVSWDKPINNNFNYFFNINKFHINYFDVTNSGFTGTLKNELEIKQSETDDFVLEILYQSNGADRYEANNYLNDIQYIYKIDGNTLKLNNNFHIPKTSKIRNQFVHPILYVPKGKFVKIEGISHIYTYDNSQGWIDFYYQKSNIFSYNQTLECTSCNSNSNLEKELNNGEKDL
ncbi:MAG: PspC domain-containing protein [Flavobacteriales bacterium]|nr:PspC domain-containing protein [Flavobacteriales bacterium]